jgi:hypothetical protein
MLRQKLGAVLAGIARGLVGFPWYLEWSETQRIGQLQLGIRGQVQGSNEIQPRTVGLVSRDCQLGSN